ncbi:succinate dehydrogenase/fumarate reductase iron-sulfur subunit [Gracilinema caldarium]|uniref:Fumarate reductase iron-sulfur subunit n=1 Tax=Gracilinema caldarium (strain ATCC 51460 / DSM 7334 / H1) TaxID=744872 RepID=F8EZZ0_GRAC1|nr:2Fe-2S iron-sulfur cluster-binding protein [Gracilinema caldarium]AEJ18503.1 succinate dehydrogenase and fumarate reductase iron-sulfur protein [Gracilinema caldarium DSM 7334]
MKQSLRIKRGTDDDALYYVYEVDLPSGSSVLDALEYIRTGSVPDLMYRHSCHHGSCGTCAVRINGKEVLACLTRLEAYTGTIPTIEPLAAFKHDRDLVIDPGSLFRRLPKDAAKLRRSEWSGGEIIRDPADKRQQSHPSGIEHFVRFEDCIECGACISACPVTRQAWAEDSLVAIPFLGPAVLVALHRESINNPERRDEMLELAKLPNGVSACEKHFDCSRVCPRMVAPGKHIEQLRKELSDRSKD